MPSLSSMALAPALAAPVVMSWALVSQGVAEEAKPGGERFQLRHDWPAGKEYRVHCLWESDISTTTGKNGAKLGGRVGHMVSNEYTLDVWPVPEGGKMFGLQWTGCVAETRSPGKTIYFDSRKGGELAANPHAAIVLHWPEVLRQVRATGRVERLSDAESDAYWYARPRASRVGAWASAQSRPIATREELEARVAEVEARFDGVDVARPDGWGGFRVVPDEIEFWQHRDDRLHDRFVYSRPASPANDESDHHWQVVRLQP